MTVLEEMLLEEYERSHRLIAAYQDDIAGLPRGSVGQKHVDGRTYYYLQYRDNGKVKSTYVRKADVELVIAAVNRRRELESSIREQERGIRQIERALGKRFIREHVEAGRGARGDARH